MASTSLSMAAKGPKESERKKEDDMKNEGKKREFNDMHVKLDYKLIEHLKNLKNWPEMKPPMEKPEENPTEEQIEEMSKRTFDFDGVLQNDLLDEEIVWAEDVWGLQRIVGAPDDHANEAKNS